MEPCRWRRTLTLPLAPLRPVQERAMLEELGLLDDVMEADAGRVRA